MASEASENTIFIRFQFTQPQDTLSTIHRPYLKQDRARKDSCSSKIKQQIIRMLREHSGLCYPKHVGVTYFV